MLASLSKDEKIQEHNGENTYEFGYRLVKIPKDIRNELVRKSLHLLIACTPMLTFIIGVPGTILLLGLGVLLYTAAEWMRITGRRIPIISRITELAMRDRDRDHFVLGPVTLGMGAMLALFLYPEPAVSVAIYALAFGDGLSSVGGKLVNSVRIPFTKGKTLAGSLTCFFAVLLAILLLVPGLTLQQATIIALASTLLEAIPIRDFDNLILPAGAGLVALWILQYHI